MRKVQVPDLVEYLSLSDWQKVDDSGDKWLVFVGPPDANEQPLELVLPSAWENASDLPVYLTTAVNLIAALKDESLEKTIDRIRHYDSDVLYIRNVETGGYSSVPLLMASQQVARLKQLVAYAASSEKDPRPRFDRPLYVGQKMTKHFRFGHTVAGSFSYTVESHVAQPRRSFQQLRLLDDVETDDADQTFAPFERRTMERIIRGLLSVRAAVEENDYSVLLDQWEGGLNSKMCEVIAELSRDQSQPMEYEVLWSPRIPADEDVRPSASILLRERAYDLLERAADELSTVKPRKRTIRGMVTDLSSADAPLGRRETERSVIIRWLNRPQEQRPVKILVSLDRDSYALAHRAHLDWDTVEVEGYPSKVGSKYILGQPSNFRIVETGIRE